jgi:uncharacterized membrane protein
MIRTGLIASAAGLALTTGAWFWLADALPINATQVPVHWGFDGVADAFASRAEALAWFALLPGASLVMTALFCLIPVIEPLRENLMRGHRAYLTAWIGVQAMMALLAAGLALLTARSVGAAEANVDLFVRGVIAGAGVLLMFLGDAMPKTRPNFFLGVRTPWTLSSDLAWERTNRLSGRLMVLVGLWGVVAAFLLNGLALAFAVCAPLIVAVLIACAYSYFVWRADPERRRPAQEA